MSNLFVCETYFQLIVSIFVGHIFFADTKNDIVLANKTNGMEQIQERLKLETCFNRVYFARLSEKLKYERNYGYYEKLIRLLVGNTRRVSEEVFNETGIIFDYDNLFFYNGDLFNWLICDNNAIVKPAYKQYIIEEGLLSYSYLIKPIKSRGLEVLANIRKKIRKRYLRDKIEGIYCFYPEIVPDNKGIPFYKIPLCQKAELLPIIQRVFDCSKEDSWIEEKYVYFGGFFDAEGIRIDEEKIVLKLADFVGKENLIVKKHPRDKRDIYERLGIKTISQKPVPWEVMFMTGDYTDKVFITLSSSSIITAFSLDDQNGKGIYLFPMYTGKNARFDRIVKEQKIEETLSDLKEKGCCRSVSIIYDEKELERVILDSRND